jgi:hypothetical protein
MKNASNSIEYEHCVLCGELTDVPVSMPIDFRNFYEVGCGQLCAACHMKIGKSSQKGKTISTTRMELMVEQSRENK